MNVINITPIVEAVVTLICVIASMFVIPFLKTKCDVENIIKIESIVVTCVRAAEQIGKTLGLDGQAKKEMVVSWLESKGIVFDEDINAFIEKAVYDMNNQLINN